MRIKQSTLLIYLPFLLMDLMIFCMEQSPYDKVYEVIQKEGPQLGQEHSSFLLEELRLLDRAIANSLKEISPWHILPNEVIVHIFSFIPEHIKNVMLVNKNFYALTHEPKVLGLALRLLINKDIKKAIHFCADACE